MKRRRLFSDCARCEALIRLERGALNASIIRHHTAVERRRQLAAAAGVKTLVLSHLVPAEDPRLTDATSIDAARARFRGRIVVGRDLMEL